LKKAGRKNTAKTEIDMAFPLIPAALGTAGVFCIALVDKIRTRWKMEKIERQYQAEQKKLAKITDQFSQKISDEKKRCGVVEFTHQDETFHIFVREDHRQGNLSRVTILGTRNLPQEFHVKNRNSRTKKWEYTEREDLDKLRRTMGLPWLITSEAEWGESGASLTPAEKLLDELKNEYKG